MNNFEPTIVEHQLDSKDEQKILLAYFTSWRKSKIDFWCKEQIRIKIPVVNRDNIELIRKTLSNNPVEVATCGEYYCVNAPIRGSDRELIAVYCDVSTIEVLLRQSIQLCTIERAQQWREEILDALISTFSTIDPSSVKQET